MRPVCLGTPFHFYPAEPLVPGVFDPRSPQAVLPRRQAGTNEELKGQVIRMRPTERADAMETERLYRPGDKDTPEELEELLRRVLSKHPENSTNPHYTALMNLLWHRCITLAPDEEVKIPLARLMFQEIEHGVITARILKHLGVDKVENPIEQYMFHLPIESWVDLCYFHALGDRVGMYIGETWGEVPYEPLRKVTPKLHRDEVFHASLGMANLKKLCKTERGRGAL